jgi:hypothetical protein
MITEQQMYEEYIATQEKKLQELLIQITKIKEDIDNVTKLMLSCPYDKTKISHTD